MTLSVHPDKMDGLAKTTARLGPDVCRGGGSEEGLVTFDGPAVPIMELPALGSAALGGAVVKRFAENPAAEVFPVRLGVKHVEMPRLIHFIGRGYRMPCGKGKEGKPHVFANHTLGVDERPAILTSQAFREGKRRGHIIRGIRFQTLQKFKVLGFHRFVFHSLKKKAPSEVTEKMDRVGSIRRAFGWPLETPSAPTASGTRFRPGNSSPANQPPDEECQSGQDSNEKSRAQCVNDSISSLNNDREGRFGNVRLDRQP